ncbi:hypothetical protein [Sphingomonas sp. HMP6]|uniref:hypothetical protein n=1 Tax=Sphingomonas sp. HMP6 TaxID=1517551 RepID=UPI001596D687|nr:hypothetical protein [Sphingomonas sp. HMP6]BCA57733.1 hypothetical protein HMP06_0502 [Sphingomonas sp. HMP6]
MGDAQRHGTVTGSVGILNVGAGDTKLVFDNTDPAETARSAAIVKDMIRRGFVLLIEVGRNEKGPIYQRAHDFDAETVEYIVAGAPTTKEPKSHEQKPPVPARPRRQAKAQRIPASSTNAVAVARTAGG